MLVDTDFPCIESSWIVCKILYGPLEYQDLARPGARRSRVILAITSRMKLYA